MWAHVRQVACPEVAVVSSKLGPLLRVRTPSLAALRLPVRLGETPGQKRGRSVFPSGALSKLCRIAV